MKTKRKDSFTKMGIVRYGHSLAWGLHHGRLRWAPYPIRKFIITSFNWVTCRLFGHEFYYWEEDDKEEVCCNCSKKRERKNGN